MREIKETNQYKRDYKRVKKSGRYTKLDADLSVLINLLSTDRNLLLRYKDQPLTGNWKGHRSCHIKPDLILIYRKPDSKLLKLVRLGSHSDLKLAMLLPIYLSS